jgi:chemotaxis signal transduction protein
MRIAAEETRPRVARRGEPAILFSVGHQMFAISAQTVQEIRSTDGLAGEASEIKAPLLASVRHTLEHGRRNLYVVNACAHFDLPVARPALVLILRKIRVAVLVDRIERMADIPALYPLPKVFRGHERRWYRGLTYVDDQVIPVVDPQGFISAPEFEQLDRANVPPRATELESAVPS